MNPKRGDILHLAFDPASGREMKGNHFCLMGSTEVDPVCNVSSDFILVLVLCRVTATGLTDPEDLATSSNADLATLACVYAAKLDTPFVIAGAAHYVLWAQRADWYA